MAKAQPVVETTKLVKVKMEGQQLLTPLAKEVQSLTVEDDDGYHAADVLLGDVRRARGLWRVKIGPILNPMLEALDHAKKTVAAAKKAMAGAEALNEEVDGPLEAMETQVIGRMRAFKIRQAQQLREAQEAQDAEERRIQAELEETRRREEAARTRPMAAKLATKRIELETQAAALEEDRPVAPPKTADHSQARTVKSWRFVGAEQKAEPTPEQLEAVLQHILNGTLPLELIQFRMAEVHKQFVRDPQVVAEWPGFELYDDVVIARR